MNLEFNVIGKIPDIEGVYTEEGEVITPPTYKPGWHVNMAELVPEMSPFQVFPVTPYRVFSGVTTIFLRFDNREQWQEFLSEE